MALILFAILSDSGKLTLPVEHTPQFDHPNLAAFPPRLQAQGSVWVNSVTGRPVLLRGLMPQDPSRLDNRNRFNRKIFEQMQAAGANVVRIPVHPEEWQRDPDYLWRYLEPSVAWAGELGMYAVIDLHFIGNPVTGAGDQMPNLDSPPMDFALAFWSKVATHFKPAPNVVFEIYNEPANIQPAAWLTAAQQMVAAIRATGANQPILVGGVEYSRDLSWVLADPIEDPNLGYVAHIYPAHSKWSWDHWFGEVAAQHPVLVTEWGFMDENRADGPSYLAGDAETYGEPLLAYLAERRIGWIACWYDDEWLPQMFADEFDQPTKYGAWLLGKLAQPATP
jgi:hypothetical protein